MSSKNKDSTNLTDNRDNKNQINVWIQILERDIQRLSSDLQALKFYVKTGENQK